MLVRKHYHHIFIINLKFLRPFTDILGYFMFVAQIGSDSTPN